MGTRKIAAAFNMALRQEGQAHTKGYNRHQYQTYLTSPEWRNVEISVEFAEFLRQSKPFYRYNYFKEISTFWRIFADSYNAARQHNSAWDIITSEYMVMNIFVGTFTTITCGLKGLISWPLMQLLPKENPTVFQQHAAKAYADYAKFIHKIPFFNFDYFASLKSLWGTYRYLPAKDKSYTDFATLIVTTIEFIGNGIIGWPIAKWYNMPQNKEDDKIHLIVKTKADETPSPENSKLNNAELGIKTHEILHKDDSTTNYQHVTVPRYQEFEQSLRHLASILDPNKKEKICYVSGNDKIQFKIESKDEDQDKTIVATNNLLYAYKGSSADSLVLQTEVVAKDICSTINDLDANNIKIKQIHDF